MTLIITSPADAENQNQLGMAFAYYDVGLYSGTSHWVWCILCLNTSLSCTKKLDIL